MIRDFLPMCVSYGKAEEIARVTINCSINGKGTFTLISKPCPVIKLLLSIGQGMIRDFLPMCFSYVEAKKSHGLL